jgi:hypothetical protein
MQLHDLSGAKKQPEGMKRPGSVKPLLRLCIRELLLRPCTEPATLQQ